MGKILDFLVQEITLRDYSVKLWVLLLVAIALCFVLIFIIVSNANAKKEKMKQKQLQEEASQCLASRDTAQCLDIETNIPEKDTVDTKQQIQPDMKVAKKQAPEQAKENVELDTKAVKQATPKSTKTEDDTQLSSKEAKQTMPTEPKKDIQPKKQTANVSVRFEIALKADGYRYMLLSSNDELLYESIGYTTANGANRGIDTFKNAVQKGGFVIDKDELNRFKFSLSRRYIGENYKTEEQCKEAIKLIESFIQSAETIPYEKDEQQEKAFAKSGFNKKIDLIEWDEVEAKEKSISPSGKYEIVKIKSGYYFYLVDNKGKYLYFSMPYASVATTKENIKTFKRAVHSGLFGIDKSNNNKFRFVLKGGNSTYLGEYYDTSKECQESIDTLMKLGKSASLPN